MTKKEMTRQLQEASNWIFVVSKESDEPHITSMLEGIENAINNLSMEVIEVDIMFNHPDDDETIKVYDVEGMREEFEYELENLLNKNEND